MRPAPNPEHSSPYRKFRYIPMKEISFDPSRKIGLTSDTHYGHANIIQYCLRPWLSDAELTEVQKGNKIKVSDDTLRRHDDALVERINDTLGPDDVLIHAGDVAWRGLETLREFRERVRVREIYFTVGNHDKEEDLCEVFGRERVAERFALTVGEQLAIVDHYPADRWHNSHYGSWLLFGHCHGALNAARRTNPAYSMSIDIGVDSHDFRPWLWPELVALFAERKPTFERWRAKAYPGKDAGGMAPVGLP